MTAGTTICIHAWYNTPEGDQTYSDPQTDPVDGWCVYRRVDTPASQMTPFHTSDEEDFPDHPSALAWAEQLSAEHACSITEY